MLTDSVILAIGWLNLARFFSQSDLRQWLSKSVVRDTCTSGYPSVYLQVYKCVLFGCVIMLRTSIGVVCDAAPRKHKVKCIFLVV